MVPPSERTVPPELRRALRRVQGRLVAQYALAGSLLVIAAALAGVALAAFAQWLGVDVGPRPSAIGMALLAIVAVVIRAAREPWSAARVARRVEQSLGWQERLSTALETPAHASIVAAVLHRDVATLCSTFDARRVAPWTWPQRLIATVVVSGIGALAAGALPLVAPSVPTSIATEARDDGVAAAAPISVDALLRLADAVEADAQRRFDPYLSGVADALRDLGERIDRGEVASDEMRSSLEAVLEHLARAYDSDTAGATIAERMLNTPSGREAIDETSEDPTGLDTLRFSAAELGSADLERVLAAAEEPEPASEFTEAGTGGAQPPGTQMTGYGSQELRDIAEARRQQSGDLTPPGPGELVGAADDADAGASRVAGRGSQALEGDPTEVDAESAIDDVLAIRGRERDEGRRIDVELASAVGWDDYDAAAFQVGAWVMMPEPNIRTDTSDLRYRPMLGRYFVPDHETVNHARRDGR